MVYTSISPEQYMGSLDGRPSLNIDPHNDSPPKSDELKLIIC